MRRPSPTCTRADLETAARAMVETLAAPGTLTARNFAQINLAETLCVRFRAWFDVHAAATPELVAVEIIAPLYRERFPLT